MDRDWRETRESDFKPFMEVCRILRELSQKVVETGEVYDRNLRDVNGNVIGTLSEFKLE